MRLKGWCLGAKSRRRKPGDYLSVSVHVLYNLVYPFFVRTDPIHPFVVPENVMGLSHSVKRNNLQTPDIQIALMTERGPCVVFHLLDHDRDLLFGKFF